MERRERLKRRANRRLRQDRIWHILRVLTTYNDLYCSQNFYEYRDNLRSFNESIIALANANTTKRDYEIALRFCDFKFRRGKCGRSITQAEKDFLLSGKNIEVNCSEILKAVIASFRNYWEEVLISYKKASARKNRLNYLVDKLGEVKDWPEICNDIDAVKEISDLQAFYSEQANQM